MSDPHHKERTEKPDVCEFRCDKEPEYEVAHTYHDKNSYSWLCGEHKNMESIHDPLNTEVITEPWEIDE